MRQDDGFSLTPLGHRGHVGTMAFRNRERSHAHRHHPRRRRRPRRLCAVLRRSPGDRPRAGAAPAPGLCRGADGPGMRSAPAAGIARLPRCRVRRGRGPGAGRGGGADATGRRVAARRSRSDGARAGGGPRAAVDRASRDARWRRRPADRQGRVPRPGRAQQSRGALAAAGNAAALRVSRARRGHSRLPAPEVGRDPGCRRHRAAQPGVAARCRAVRPLSPHRDRSFRTTCRQCPAHRRRRRLSGQLPGHARAP